MSGKVDNYLTTPCGSTKLKKLDYPLRYSTKNIELTSSSIFFYGAEFVELDMFGNAELKWSGKNWSGAVPNTPLIRMTRKEPKKELKNNCSIG